MNENRICTHTSTARKSESDKNDFDTFLFGFFLLINSIFFYNYYRFFPTPKMVRSFSAKDSFFFFYNFNFTNKIIILCCINYGFFISILPP